MSSDPLPQAFWFRVAASCPKVEGIPHSGSKSSLLSPPDAAVLPILAPLDGRDVWATARAGGNAREPIDSRRTPAVGSRAFRLDYFNRPH